MTAVFVEQPLAKPVGILEEFSLLLSFALLRSSVFGEV